MSVAYLGRAIVPRTSRFSRATVLMFTRVIMCVCVIERNSGKRINDCRPSKKYSFINTNISFAFLLSDLQKKNRLIIHAKIRLMAGGDRNG